MRIYAVANQKGGPGKTAVSLGLIDAFVGAGKKVLAVDTDPQANLTEALGVEVTEDMLTLNDVLYAGGHQVAEGTARDAITAAGQAWPGVDVIPAEAALAAREEDTPIARETRLRTALDGLHEAYDITVIDCRPSVGQLTINALVAADEVILVAEPAKGAHKGLGEITDTLLTVQRHYNEALRIGGLMLNKLKARGSDTARWEAEIRADYEPFMLPASWGLWEDISRSHSEGRPLSSYRTEKARVATEAIRRNAAVLLERI